MLLPAVSNFVSGKIGEQFTTPPLTELAAVFKDSSANTPLIFVLSPGADPLTSLEVCRLKEEGDRKDFIGSRSGSKSSKENRRRYQGWKLGRSLELPFGCELDGQS